MAACAFNIDNLDLKRRGVKPKISKNYQLHRYSSGWVSVMIGIEQLSLEVSKYGDRLRPDRKGRSPQLRKPCDRKPLRRKDRNQKNVM